MSLHSDWNNNIATMNLKTGSRGALKNYSQQSSRSYSQRTSSSTRITSRNTNNERSFRSNYCSKIFRRKDSLTWLCARQQWKDGSWVHVEEEQQSETSGCTASYSYKCSNCPKMFKLNTDLTRHQMKHVIIPALMNMRRQIRTNIFFIYIRPRIAKALAVYVMNGLKVNHDTIASNGKILIKVRKLIFEEIEDWGESGVQVHPVQMAVEILEIAS